MAWPRTNFSISSVSSASSSDMWGLFLLGHPLHGVVRHFPLLPHPRAGQPRSHYAGADEPRSSPTVVFGPNGAVSRCACVAGLRTNNRSVDHLSLARIEPARPAEGDTLLSSAFDARPANSPMLLQECHVWRSPITDNPPRSRAWARCQSANAAFRCQSARRYPSDAPIARQFATRRYAPDGRRAARCIRSAETTR